MLPGLRPTLQSPSQRLRPESLASSPISWCTRSRSPWPARKSSSRQTQACRAGPGVTWFYLAPTSHTGTGRRKRRVQVTSLELMAPDGQATVLDPRRPVFVVASAIPREEMRSFLEQCEREVVATGDQSIAEAVLLGKLPFTAPDAKVASWRAALDAAANGVEHVPDLGQTLRDLVGNEALRAQYVEASRRHGGAVQAELEAQFGSDVGAVVEQLARAGMYG
ncbi:unnamed protein product [Symbiodinium natans]|uniref:Uncharacterized protein n=1 Tax=Symbiodinium natans TaxID=878477 RepID=A0A812RRU2_9DINO|nr:unnamed protein product [Symbiodinium natans]